MKVAIPPQVMAIVGAVSVLTFAYLYVVWQGKKVENAGLKIEMLESENDRLAGRLEEYVRNISVLKGNIVTKEADIAQLRKEIAALPKPKPIVPLPQEPDEQVGFFRVYGLGPVVVPGGSGSLAFPRLDLPILGKSLQDAANLPLVQRELSDVKRLVSELDSLDRSKSEHIAKSDEALSLSMAQHRNAQSQVDEYRKQLVATKRKSAVSKVLWGVAGVGVGVLVRNR